MDSRRIQAFGLTAYPSFAWACACAAHWRRTALRGLELCGLTAYPSVAWACACAAHWRRTAPRGLERWVLWKGLRGLSARFLRPISYYPLAVIPVLVTGIHASGGAAIWNYHGEGSEEWPPVTSTGVTVEIASSYYYSLCAQSQYSFLANWPLGPYSYFCSSKAMTGITFG